MSDWPSNPAEENVTNYYGPNNKGIQSIAENNPEVEFILDTFEAFDGVIIELGLVDTLSNISDWYPRQ